jgi:OOP family OmpA-OmpF porin
MKRVILLGTVVAGAALGGAAVADDDTGAWYIAPMAQWWHLDPDRYARNNAAGQLALGANVSPNWSLELEGAAGEFSTYGRKLSLQKLTVDGLYKFLPDSMVHPYLIFGAGGMQDHLSGAQDTGSFEAEGGAGVLLDLGPKIGSTRWQARAELKYQHEFSDMTAVRQDVGDVVASLGVQYSFGISNPPPPAPPASPPPPPTAAAAPPPPPPPPPPPVDGDDDHDGVPNSRDRCPNTPRGDKVDEFGCTIQPEIKLEGVNFATNSADLIPESDYVLQIAVRTLKKYPELVVEVAGYTDSRGTPKYNLGLSQRRAESVVKYLKAHGVTNELSAKGYGETHPIASNKTKDGQLENRRVTLRILSGLH